jgi:hypothetical protein
MSVSFHQSTANTETEGNNTPLGCTKSDICSALTTFSVNTDIVQVMSSAELCLFAVTAAAQQWSRLCYLNVLQGVPVPIHPPILKQAV